MATSSMQKEFIITDERAYEQLKRELDNARCDKVHVNSPQLAKGREKLKQFSFHSEK